MKALPHLVSIPKGSIKIELAYRSFVRLCKFQFQKVQLKSYALNDDEVVVPLFQFQKVQLKYKSCL